MISDVVANYNLDRNGNAQPQGAPVKRNYGLDWYEFYAQDTWRMKPNITLTYGLRWSFFPPPWETNGLQTYPTFGLGSQFNQNVKNMNQGIGYGAEPPIEFNLGRGPGFYPFEKTDWSPRLSIAYSPRPSGALSKKLFGDNDRTVIRAGFSRVYDRAGFALLNSFDQIGAAGLTTTLQNTCCTAGETGAEDLPRITGIHNIPQYNLNNFLFLQPPPSSNPPWPQTPNKGAEANLWGTDNTLKTPHAYTADFSIGRELPQRFTLPVVLRGPLQPRFAYPARLSRINLWTSWIRRPGSTTTKPHLPCRIWPGPSHSPTTVESLPTITRAFRRPPRVAPSPPRCLVPRPSTGSTCCPHCARAPLNIPTPSAQSS